ncbi:RES domain-containing protein [Novosphingobium sp. PS1R-30]|uniref:RES domain-containing protein n=1 Tax=Novosphingobium anseongense TaxID=3133436 RepID=A0ABU8S0P3_9SPHN
MSGSFWRIAADTPSYEADDVSGADLLASAEQVDPAKHIGWEAEPSGRASIAFGTEWVKSRRSLLLEVPSVIVPEERNLLINPVHPDAARVSARKVRKWLNDPRVLRGA